MQNFKTVQKKSEYRIVVDRTAQTATVYHNDEAVKTFPVCTGTTGKHETDLGNFYIYLKYQIQDMTGLNDDGSRYLSKGVKWVSYFYGGEGFHTASWNNYGIAHGDPAHYGSHKIPRLHPFHHRGRQVDLRQLPGRHHRAGSRRHAIRTGTLTRYAWRGCAAFAYAVQWAA